MAVSASDVVPKIVVARMKKSILRMPVITEPRKTRCLRQEAKELGCPVSIEKD
jgi:hypothetical protein